MSRIHAACLSRFTPFGDLQQHGLSLRKEADDEEEDDEEESDDEDEDDADEDSGYSE